MNRREKKLGMILLGIVVIMGSLLAYSLYNEAYQKETLKLKKVTADLQLKKIILEESSTHRDEVSWLAKNMPTTGTHAKIRSDLVVLVENSARKNNLIFRKRPRALPENPENPENPEDSRMFHEAVVRVAVNCRDVELYRWLVELQNPLKSRSITWLKIKPQRNDLSRIDCDLEVTQWFIPPKKTDESTSK